MFDFHRLRTDVIALGLLAACVFIALSLISFDPADPPAQLVYPAKASAQNLCNIPGAYAAWLLKSVFGILSYFVLLSMIVVDVRLLARRPIQAPTRRMIGWSMMVCGGCVILHLMAPGLFGGQIVGSGGLVGAWGVAMLEAKFAFMGILVLMLATATSGFVLVTDLSPFAFAVNLATAPTKLLNRIAFGKIGEALSSSENVDRRGGMSRRESNDPTKVKVNPPKPAPELVEEDEDEVEAEIEETPEPRTPIKVNPPINATSGRDALHSRLDASSNASLPEAYQLPTCELLEDAEDFPYDLLAKKARIAAVTLEKTFQEFGLNIRVVEIDTGPVITQFELELEAGLRVSKVQALADDLAIALRVPAVRVVSPIPGKNTVGIEVPNDKRIMVRLRELIEASDKQIEKSQIPLFLGKDVSGRPLTVDMAKMPHLLIAGRTGTGKSVCLNSLILSILMTRTPDEVKMLMIDPKMVELSPYKRIPHLMHPVITDMKKAEAVLAWAVDKMEERYDLLARSGVRHLDGYNKLGKEKVLERCGIDPDSPEADEIPENMPCIVIVADEMADMMMTSGKDVEGHIIRLAQKSRAVGIHLVLATQKPTVDVITGLIKSNLPARVSFQVASRTDSRVVLDEMGAERLLGNGDMLYLAPGTSNVTRAQGTFVSDDEVNGVIDFFSDREPEYSEELTNLQVAPSTSTNEPGGRSRDDLYDRAVDIILAEGRGSVSLLQRHLGIGYGRAARLIDYMAEDGIVGDYNGSQAREVLYSFEQWEAIRDGAPTDMTAV
ncbi:MAG: DNA translocase FtsK [Planctomycetaceae bacterium]|nr:DNA translocase FtsK [Planctomycetaceae bacterium]